MKLIISSPSYFISLSNFRDPSWMNNGSVVCLGGGVWNGSQACPKGKFRNNKQFMIAQSQKRASCLLYPGAFETDMWLGFDYKSTSFFFFCKGANPLSRLLYILFADNGFFWYVFAYMLQASIKKNKFQNYRDLKKDTLRFNIDLDCPFYPMVTTSSIIQSSSP